MLLRLKMKILEKYLTQTQFSQACGIGEVRISKIVNERVKPTIKEQGKMCTALGLKNTKEVFK